MRLGRWAICVIVAMLAPHAACAGVRAIALQGDPAPGVPAATFASFPSALSSGYFTDPQCDSVGHVVFYATTSTGVAGLWTDAWGALAKVAAVGDALPGLSGPDTLTALGTFLISDHGQIAFLGITKHGVQTKGLWYRDASGLTLAADDGQNAPWLGGL